MAEFASAETAPAIALHGVCIRYDSNVVVRDISLSVGQRDIHVLLGESGSGKTTILRAIAGFEPVCSGRIEIAGRVVDSAAKKHQFEPPEKRGVGVVFQDYALFPHLDVAGNVAFGMNPELTRHQRNARVDALLEQVGLAALGRRQVSELSGGQQQRVALARALAHQPRIMLLDEPFSNLNRELRSELRERTVDILRAEHVTAIFVTHDRHEAFSIADHISVIRGGTLLQTGTPGEIYETPSSLAVARSVGDVNALDAVVCDAGSSARCALGTVPLRQPATIGHRGQLLVRPSQLAVTLDGDGHHADLADTVSAQVERVVYFGSYTQLYLRLDDSTRLVANASGEPIQTGQHVLVSLKDRGVYVPFPTDPSPAVAR
ncbi:MAG: ABC transporter ATP-binding protein [Proteobacteria bacterium]|nr:ABC transporter ATP-binding protein [Pseudomonadota bacterium]